MVKTTNRVSKKDAATGSALVCVAGQFYRMHGFVKQGDEVFYSRRPSFLVTLAGFTFGRRMPVRRAMGTQSFSEETMRDFFACMATRVEGWKKWGRKACREGGDALTRHIWALFVVSPIAGYP